MARQIKIEQMDDFFQEKMVEIVSSYYFGVD